MEQKTREEIIPYDLIPDVIGGINLNEEVKTKLSYGLESPMYKDILKDNEELIDGKISLSYDEATNQIGVYYNERANTLKIDGSIFGIELEDEQKEKLLNNETLGPIKHKGKDFFVNIDDELNKVVVKTSYEIGVPNEIGGYIISEIEKSQLSRGNQMDTKIFEQDGNYFSAKVSLSKDKTGLVFNNIKSVTKERASELKDLFNVVKVEESKRIQKETLLIGMDSKLDYLYNEKPVYTTLKEIKPLDLKSDYTKDGLNTVKDKQRQQMEFISTKKHQTGYSVKAKNPFVPYKLKGVHLSNEQRNTLLKGQPTLIKGMKDHQGNIFQAHVVINKEGIDYQNKQSMTYKSMNSQIQKQHSHEL